MPRALLANVDIMISACLYENWQVNILFSTNNFKPPGGTADKKPPLVFQKQIPANSVL